MIPAAFEYVRARDVEDGLRLLAEHGDGAKLLAGGHSLIPMMKLRLATPTVVIDIGAIPGLDAIVEEPGRLHIGALTKHATLAASAVIARRLPVLSQAASVLGDPQVRNRGTIGGACAHGDPSADYPAVMLALGATLTVTGPAGTRRIAADDFFLGMFETALDPSEMLTEIAADDAPHSAYVKFPHPASGYAVVGVAAVVRTENERIASARIAVTGVGDAHFRARGVEQALAGVAVGDAGAVERACANAAAGVEARGDHYASGEYRAAVADVFAQRAVCAALGLAPPV